ncbi:carboxypeptidase regulatory-like domain-containing protein [Bryobacter aggregatus]|uniref:carboxypeptidase regulatory-like domain-containing protein n=1 Tax=Bryobacter aggregatus TaxID=360054 RepID=UPI0004E18DC5|nr:carboxypeptidase regulatory-like domain-containing protein [Bryobacter aggregatus]
MRLIGILTLGFALFAQQQAQTTSPPAGTQADPNVKLGRITGKVLNAITGEPVRKATVTLQPAGAQGGAQTLSSAASARAISASTDNAGAFVFESVNAGTYRLSGEKTGFIRTNFGGRGGGAIGSQLVVGNSGAEIPDVIVRITPQGVVSGRILDEDGEPMEGVSVQLIRPQYFANQRRMMGTGGNQTNDKGEFRVTNVAPGRYYVQIQNMRMGGAPLQQAAEEFGYPKLFYPGVESMDQAQKVDVAAGQEFSGIQMTLRKVRVYRVRGRVAGVQAPAAPQQAGGGGRGGPGGGGGRPGMNIQLRPEGGSSDMMGPGFGPGMGRGSVRNDGSFELASVTPGAYKLVVSDFGQGRPRVIGSAKISVGNNNVDGIVISPMALITMQGKITVEGDQSAVNLKSVRVQIQAADMGGLGFIPPISVGDDGTFSVADVSPEKYRVVVSPGTAAYVKAINVGGEDVKDTGLDLSNGGGGNVDIILSTKVAKLDGIVEKQKTDDAPGSALVARVGADGELSLLNMTGGQTSMAQADSSGKFSYANLPPGDYKVFAFEEVDTTTASDPDFLKKFVDRSVSVKIGEGESKSITLKQIRYAESSPQAQ